MLEKLRTLRGALAGSRPPAAGRSRRFTPALERLEGREVPALFFVTTPLDVVSATDGKLSLREAISAANAHPGPDTIILGPGVYRLALAGADDANATGDLDVTDSTTFAGVGAGLTIIDGNQIDRVFDVRGATPHSIHVTFQNLTIRNGLADAGPGIAGGGGGIRVGNADLLLMDCAVTGNRTTGFGGGISNAGFADTANVTLVRTAVSHNFAGNGGGLAVLASLVDPGSVLTVLGGSIQGNHADNGGGGIFSGKVNLTGCLLTGNTSGFNGGGIFTNTATLTNCLLTGNHSTGLDAGALDADAATLTNCTLTGNTAAADGGAMSVGTLTLTNTTVSGNTAGNNGGGIIAVTATLIGSTVRGNSAPGQGGGINARTATLTRSSVTGNSAGTDAGGLFAQDTATLTASTVSGNFAGHDGGGLWADTATLTGTSVSGNFAGHTGGGLFATTASLTKSTVSGNHAITAFGGGIAALETATLTGSTIEGNSAGADGGALWADAAKLTDSTVSGNHTGGTGGGILTFEETTLTRSTVSGNFAGADAGGLEAFKATLTDSTVSGNHSLTGIGGGIVAVTATLTNSTISGNTANGQGGGIFAIRVSLLNATVTDNSAHTGGGVFLQAGGTSSVRNSIIAGNFIDLGGTGPDLAGAFTSGGHNLIAIGDGSTGFANGVNGDLVGTATDPIDPRLGPLANNGGPTQTHALLPGSPAIDHGDNADAPATDQRGVARPRDGDGNGSRVVDIGAFEK
jgi:predicted outer membrane repeat protein